MQRIRRSKFFVGLMLVAVMLSMFLAGCGSGASMDSSVSGGSDKNWAAGSGDKAPIYNDGFDGSSNGVTGSAPPSSAVEDGPDKSDTSVAEGRKLVRTANLWAESDRYDEFLSWLDGTVSSLGGYFVERNELSNDRSYWSDVLNDVKYYRTRSLDCTVRLPEDSLNLFLNSLDGSCNVISRSVSADDVTLEYTDVESRVKAYQTEYDRLTELLEQAADLDTILAIESRMSEVRYELDSYESRLRVMDNLVDYATVQLNVEEVTELTELMDEPVGFLAIWKASFVRGWKLFIEDVQDFLYWVAEYGPVAIFRLFIFGLFILIVIKVIKKIRSRSANKKLKRVLFKNRPLERDDTNDDGMPPQE